MIKQDPKEKSEKDHFERLSLKYDKNYNYLDKFTKYKILRKTSDFEVFIKKHIKSNNIRILEVGCGTGEYTKHIASIFPKASITALDISPKIIEVAKKKLHKSKNVKFVSASAYNAGFASHSFDVVCGFYVLHHLELDKFSKEFYRLLRPNGVGFFYEPNVLNPVVYAIKSLPFLKRLVGDSPNEWAINPLTVSKIFFKSTVKCKITDYLIPLKSFSSKILISMDRLSSFFSQLPIINLLGGSTQVCISPKIITKSQIGSPKGQMHMSNYLLKKFNQVEKIHWWWEGRREFIRTWLKKDKHMRLLDVGCGTGETLSFIEREYPDSELFGVDYSRRAIKYSKLRGHKNIKFSDAVLLPFPKEKFDNVLILDTLEHIEDDLGVITEATRVLKKGGRIIVTAPALKFIWSEHDTNQGHKRRYSLSEMRSLAKRANLRIVWLTYFNTILSLPIIVIRVIGKLNFMKFLSNYDSGLNYDIAFNKPLNNILRLIFVNEIRINRVVSYPIGISIGAVFEKK